ncbi:hypothetical protein QYE76_044499, partial [Lolium multiflorum]
MGPPIGRRGPRPGRAALWGGGPQPPRPPLLRVLLRPENLSHRGYVAKSHSRLCGAENTREKRALRRAGIRRGNSLPQGEIDAIVIVIELDIISITIVIIIIIITAISTAAPRHRCIAMDEVRKKLFSISLSGKAAHWYKLLKNRDSLDWEDIVPLFYSKFYPPSEIHKDRNRIYNFWPHDGESIAQAWGRLKSLMLKCPIHELPGNVIIDNFYARLSFQDKTLLDTSCSGSFTRNKEEFKRDLLDRIQENTEGWENDKDRESGIIFDYKCIEAFMDTDKFRNMSATYGLDSQVVANLYKAFASHYELPKKNFDKYHEPYKDKIDSSVNKCVVIETVDHVIPEAYIEKTPFPAKMKEYSVISSAVNKSEKKPIEPEEQIKVEPAVAIVKDLVTENVEDGHIIFCEDASNIVSHPNKSRKTSVPMLSVRIGDHCYYGLCDIGASISAIPYELYTEIMHEIGSCELEDIDVVIRLANRETISPIGIVRDVEVLCGKIKYPADFLVLGSAASKYCPIIFGRPFLNTCGAVIDCKKEKIVTKFAGESYEFNFSKFAKTPYKADLPNNDFRVEQCASIALAPTNPLQQHLENSESEVFREERNELDEIFLRQPILKHDLPVEDLGTTPPPKEDPVFDLKPLPDNLKYAHIDDKKIYPVIISSKLSEIEEERLLEILKKHRGAIGYTLDDLKGISPSICQHAINMEDDAKPVVEHQRRLIPKMKEVVRNEVLKLLEAGIIYPIADSRWVSPVHCVPKKGGMTVVPNDNDELIPQRVVVGYRMCIDFQKVNKDPATYEEAMMSPDSNKWQEAMKSEMGSMYDNKVWTLVDLPDSRKAVENKWIFKRKTDADGNITVYKARLVAKGFRQIQGVDYDETFSPVAKLKSVRILLAIAAFFDYEIWQMDVKTAFLNGDIEEELYMVQPKGFVDPKNADKVCKLQRSIYGLKQASRSWNLRFDRVIKDFGFIRTHGEACIYKKYFSMKDLGEAAYILGIKIYRDRSRRLIGLSQSTYLDKILKKFRMDESKKGFLPMLPGKVLSKTQGPATADERERMSKIPYASAVGSIMYAMLCTRPDIAHAVSLTSRYQSDPGMEHWTAVKNILKYLKRTKDMFLCYGGDQELVVTSYTDASWNTDPDDSKSQSGYVFILNGAAVSWSSSKQCTVAKSSTESEYIAASEASSEAVWMKRFIVELGVVPSALDPLVIYCDNTGAIANAKEPRSHKKLKHIKLRFHSIREYIEDGEVEICKVHTDLNVADPLTKALPRAKHDQHQNAMGV